LNIQNQLILSLKITKIYATNQMFLNKNNTTETALFPFTGLPGRNNPPKQNEYKSFCLIPGAFQISPMMDG
jgi:hypothetical protein